MYKLFLCLRYLRSRAIAYFAVVGVALCVAMMVIVISVMNGFLGKIETAARGLFGEVLVMSEGLGGIEEYESMIRWLKDPREFPEVEAATPFIATYGILRVPGFDYRQTVQVVGIRLSGEPSDAAAVSDFYHDVSSFAEGLHFQRGPDGEPPRRPSFAPGRQELIAAIERERERVIELAEKAQRRGDEQTMVAAGTALELQRRAEILLGQAEETDRRIAAVEQHMLEVRRARNDVEDLAVELADARTEALPEAEVQAIAERLTAAKARLATLLDAGLIPPTGGDVNAHLDSLEELLRRLQARRFEPPERRAILGLGIPGLIHRTLDAETIRKISPGNKVILSMAPFGRDTLGPTRIDLVDVELSVVDDCRTDVSSIDQNIVYLPFEALQRLTALDLPPRCSQVLINVRPEHSDPESLLKLRAKIEGRLVRPGAMVVVKTWRERLSDVIGPLEKNRTLSVIMFGIVSLVSVVLIFVIFYMIVVQKTRDIGVLKAVGASSGGVAGIFLAYGAAVGLIGSALGSVGGYFFVRYINEIQDAVDRWFGFRVWSKEVFLFERIPNRVNFTTMLWIVVAAVAAGVIGALIPAARAARMQPVEALRYE
jgi:lipoprotein-releasing system permease protein